MALGILMIIFIVLIITAVIIQFLLYKRKNESKNSVFIINMLFGILISYLAYTSLPTNFTEQRILATAWGVLSIFAMVLKLKNRKFIIASKLILSVAIVGSLVQLFL